MDYKALILGQSSAQCPTTRCAALTTFVEASRIFSRVHQQSGSTAGTIPFIPDIVLLRMTGEYDAQAMAAYCRRRWNGVSVMALFCRSWRPPRKDVRTFVNRVDDFLSCPFREAEFSFRVERLLQSNSRRAISSSGPKPKETLAELPLVGKSPCFLRVIDKIPALARVDQTVLISGETGSGKEVVARAIHYQSRRQGKPFIPVNCGALPDHLSENEVFGHAKGAFTDASTAENGLIAEAEGGTLFLDEIDSLSMAAQVKLLRFLENGEYRPLGPSRSKVADVRVIAATNADLLERIKARTFRADLYYRLNGLSVSVPSLRDRIEDVVPLAKHFLQQYAREYGQKPRVLSKDALRKLMSYSWPGNVRELESAIRRALILSARHTLRREEIDIPVREPEEPAAGKPPRRPMKGTIQVLEREYLMNLLTTSHGNITHAAQAAGKQRRTLQRLLRKYSLDRHSFRL
jgi:DNA-binding NtrC family response regulator